MTINLWHEEIVYKPEALAGLEVIAAVNTLGENSIQSKTEIISDAQTLYFDEDGRLIKSHAEERVLSRRVNTMVFHYGKHIGVENVAKDGAKTHRLTIIPKQRELHFARAMFPTHPYDTTSPVKKPINALIYEGRGHYTNRFFKRQARRQRSFITTYGEDGFLKSKKELRGAGQLISYFILNAPKTTASGERIQVGVNQQGVAKMTYSNFDQKGNPRQLIEEFDAVYIGLPGKRKSTFEYDYCR